MDRGNIAGTVKWYDPSKGYGFISVPELEEDVLLNSAQLLAYGQSSILTGSLVEFSIVENGGRYRVSEINRYQPEEPAEKLPETNHLDGLVLQPARTKWFCKHRAYGFAVAFKTQGDIFIGSQVLARAGLASLDNGEAISVMTEETDRGLVALKVLPWQ